MAPKIFIHLFLCFVSLVLTTPNSCYGQSKSRIGTFLYGGFGDNLYSTFRGKIFYTAKTKESKDTLLPLKIVQVFAYDSTGKLYKKMLSNGEGEFTMEFRNAIYSIKLIKPGFQSLTMTNYYSIADQFADAEIILEEGSQSQVEKIPDPVKN